jgi:PilZ domain
VIDEEQSDEVSPEERRHHDRARLIVDVHFDGAESTGVASTKDISPGGLYMTTSSELPVGAMLAIRIPIGTRHVIVKGEVIYSNPGEGVGIKFRGLSDEDRSLLEHELPEK